MNPKASGQASIPSGQSAEAALLPLLAVTRSGFGGCWISGGSPVTPTVLSHSYVQIMMWMFIGFSVRPLSDTKMELKHSLTARNLEVTGETHREKDLKTDCVKC